MTIGNYLVFVPLILLAVSAIALYTQKEVQLDRLLAHAANGTVHIDERVESNVRPLKLQIDVLQRSSEESRRAFEAARQSMEVGLRDLAREIRALRAEDQRSRWDEFMQHNQGGE